MSEPAAPRICVLADDLIWASRLVAAVERAGATPLVARSADELAAILPSAPALTVIDLGGRRYDGLAAVATAAAAGPTIAVAQHEDLELRRRALAAGATRVYSYNKLFRDGAQVLAGLVAAPVANEAG